jgi:hypothetical protein
LYDVASKQTDSSRFDPPLLKRIADYRTVLKRGIDRVSMPDLNIPVAGQIDPEVVQAASELALVTPNSQRVRLTGRLDLMGANQGVLKIEVSPGNIVTALWEGGDPIEKLREFFNRDVVVEGMAVLGASGSLLRIDADQIVQASLHDDFFRTVPTATVMRDYTGAARLRPGEPSAYRRLRGAIPAEESDADFEAAIAALR